MKYLIVIFLFGGYSIADGWGSSAIGSSQSRIAQIKESQAKVNSNKTTCAKYINIRNNSQYRRFLEKDDIDIVDLDSCKKINIVISIENVRDYDVHEGLNIFSSHLNLNGKLKHKQIYTSLTMKNCKFKGIIQSSLNVNSTSGSIQSSSIVSNSNIQSSKIQNTANRRNNRTHKSSRSSSVYIRNSEISVRVSGQNNYIKHGKLGNKIDTNGRRTNINNSHIESNIRTNNSNIEGANTGNHIRLNRDR
jgi:hypothetical protein